jgi:phospholipid-translocating ATPase
VYSITYAFAPIALYQGWLLVGYATLYTMVPVFSLVLDRDVDENLALLYPELYKELTLGKTLSYKTFLVWVLVSIYQGTLSFFISIRLVSGCVIMTLSNILVGIQMEYQLKLLAVSYTVLIVNELVMIALEINTWHVYMIDGEIASIACYFISVPFLGDYFGKPPSLDVANRRRLVFHYTRILLEVYVNIGGEFRTTMGVKGVTAKD